MDQSWVDSGLGESSRARLSENSERGENKPEEARKWISDHVRTARMKLQGADYVVGSGNFREGH